MQHRSSLRRVLATFFLVLALAGCQPPAGGAASAGGEVSEPGVLAASARSQVELGAEPVTVEVPLAPEAGRRLREVAAEPGRLRLVIEGLELLRPGLTYQVYLNLPESAAPDPGGPHFLGNLALFAEPGHAPMSRSFDLAEAVRALRERGLWTDELRVSFVPVLRDGEEAARRGPSFRFRRVAVVAS